MQKRAYGCFAALLSYPLTKEMPDFESIIAALPGDCHLRIASFREVMETLSVEAQQELFTQTFDLNPVCSLEVGWHLFGENYERGLLLVRLREELRAAEIREEGELPDHLTYTLRLLPTMEAGRAADFAGAIVLPALVKMIQALQGKNNVYEDLLTCVAVMLRNDFPEISLPETKIELPVLPEEVAL
ncbi:MAG TPA: hypothetical protein VN577_04860 [Terriglobales bacterium]|nr:hypothetical protein [Terriglobales bacterium]